ncbi:MAG: hypothetical protein HYZ71_13590 [Deltaproteobacteria bacterium]|nr:hypothetical protein [Deltaproteobacteria bacterium]
MKTTLIVTGLLFLSPTLFATEDKILGPIEAIERTVVVDPKKCLENLKMTVEVGGGGGWGYAIQVGQCEITFEDADRILQSDKIEKPFPSAGPIGTQVSLGVDGKSYHISVRFRNEGFKDKTDTARGLILNSVPRQTFLVNAIRVIAQ